jgi:hypothetical protein
MWTQYRIIKHLLGLPILLLAGIALKAAPETSPLWFVGLAIALGGFAVYIAEELYWISIRQGRPCGQCGKKIPMKSFSIHATCPHCAMPLD